jgi:hypothetical protein
MNGISIYREKPYKTGGLCTVFEINFKSIFDKINNYYWCIPDMVFRLPDSWYYGDYDIENDIYRNKEWDHFSSYYLSNVNEGLFENIVAKTGYIKEFSRYFVDDWCDIFGFEEKYIEEFKNIKNIKTIRPLFFDNKIPIYFRNIDAAYWDFYSENNELLEIIKADLGNKNVEIKDKILDFKNDKFIY